MTCRGVRGAICVEANSERAILEATERLLKKMVSANAIKIGDIAAVIFTATPDLDAAYPARAARNMGWVMVPLSCLQEMNVKGSMSRCLRVLMLWNTDLQAAQIEHVYLGQAALLRTDLTRKEEE
jgi:chorismate mutase